MQLRRLQFVYGLAGLALSGAVSAQNYVTQFNYDARGRLVKVVNDSGKEIIYTLDEAGNRTAVGDGAVTPDITSFITPRSVMNGSTATVSWTSVNTTHCTLAIFGDTSGYEYLPSNGSQSFYVDQPTGVSVKCYAGEQFDSAGRIIGISGGGPID